MTLLLSAQYEISTQDFIIFVGFPFTARRQDYAMLEQKTSKRS